MTSIGVLGAGNMGGTLIRGWAGQEGVTMAAFDPDQAKLQPLAEETGITAHQEPASVVTGSDYVLLAVKPALLQGVLQDIAPHLRSEQCLVSIAAGVQQESIKAWSSRICPVVRVMPNTPALVAEGVFALCSEDPLLSSEQEQFVRGLFERMGQVHTLPEAYFDAFTALIGSGPAYVYYFLEALREAGVSMGFPREQSGRMVLSLAKGAVRMAQEGDASLNELKEMVTSPAGTTIAGVNHLDRQAVKSSVIDAVLAAWQRSKELG
jgi:pyrroline-5-carboxylate reductase